MMYPLVEVATAIAFVAAWRAFGPTPLFATRLIFLSALIVLAVTDLRDRLLPNAITLPGIIVGLAAASSRRPALSALSSGVVIGGVVPFVVGEIYYRVRGIDGLGMGDVKMLAMIGAFLGAPLALLTLFAASFLGVVVGVPIIILTRNREYPVPLGTLLSVSAFAAAFTGTAHRGVVYGPVLVNPSGTCGRRAAVSASRSRRSQALPAASACTVRQFSCIPAGTSDHTQCVSRSAICSASRKEHVASVTTSRHHAQAEWSIRLFAD